MKTLFMWGFLIFEFLHISFALFLFVNFYVAYKNVDNQMNMASKYVNNNFFLAVTHFIPECTWPSMSMQYELHWRKHDTFSKRNTCKKTASGNNRVYFICHMTCVHTHIMIIIPFPSPHLMEQMVPIFSTRGKMAVDHQHFIFHDDDDDDETVFA